MLRKLIFPVLYSYLGLAGLVSQSLAQIAAVPSVSSSPPAAVEVYDPALASPRDTLRTFLEAMEQIKSGRPEALEDALRAMNLDELPALVRESEGRDLAVKLLGVINRTRIVNLEKVPSRRDGAPYVFRDDSDGAVIVAKENGSWRFSAETIRALPELYRAIEDQKTLHGEDESEIASLSLRIRRALPAAYREKLFQLENWQWLGIAVILLLAWPVKALLCALFAFGARIFIARFRHFASAENFRYASRPAAWFILAFLVNAGLSLLDLHQNLYFSLTVLLSLVKIVAGLLVIYYLLAVFAEHLVIKGARSNRRAYHLLGPLLNRLGEIVIYLVGAVLIARLFDVNITGIMAGLGLGGLAFALAAKDAVENLFGSITVLVDAPFAVGDLISIEGIEGTVEHIGLRSTRIRTPQNSLVSMPNSKMISSAVDNMGARRYWRIRTTLTLAYGTQAARLEAFCEGVRELVRRHPLGRKDDILVHVNQLGPSGIEILVNVFFHISPATSEVKLREELFLDMMKLAEFAGVRFVKSLPVAQIEAAGAVVTTEEPQEDLRSRAREFAASMRNASV